MSDKERKNTRVAVYLIGTRGDTVLLGKRKNTGHMDGCWSLVAGHVYEGESSTQAMMRELEEECGICIEPKELALIGSMHHKSPPYDYINFIFHLDLTNHEPQNLEMHKCEALAFHDISSLPTPMEQYVADIIRNTIPQKELWVCEYGWENTSEK